MCASEESTKGAFTRGILLGIGMLAKNIRPREVSAKEFIAMEMLDKRVLSMELFVMKLFSREVLTNEIHTPNRLLTLIIVDVQGDNR